MKLTFLGTNGWYATKTGNTTCALIETASRYIVLDAGDGIYHLDEYATDSSKPVDIFLSHFHLDHIIGLHIQPKFHFKNQIRIFGQPGMVKLLDTIINRPFTASRKMLSNIGLNISLHELSEGKNIIDEYCVHALPLTHADPCWGFRFQLPDRKKEKIISYCTDTGPCENLMTLSKDSDLLITECSLLSTDELTPSWPHMTPQAGAQAALKANAKKLVFTHFAAQKYTSLQLRKEAQSAARKIFENSFYTQDLMQFEV
ncbi:MAG: ribonuclease Z [Candidatus Micrarchaeia archaeon]